MFMRLYVEAHSWENRSMKNTEQTVHDCPNWGEGGLNVLGAVGGCPGCRKRLLFRHEL